MRQKIKINIVLSIMLMVLLLLCSLLAYISRPKPAFNDGIVKKELDTAKIDTYFFSNSNTCSVVINLSPIKENLELLDEESKHSLISKILISRFFATKNNNCPGLTSIRLIGCYIEKYDNYGRPEFGSRINILNIESDIKQLQEMELS